MRTQIRIRHLQDDTTVLSALMAHAPAPVERRAITARATALVTGIRRAPNPGLMEVFLAEYGLSTDEGISLMCLAEALLRVPDAPTIDALIEDKIAPSNWNKHLGHSSSSLVNASTWALMLTGKVLQDGTGIAATLKDAVKRLGEPVIRTAIARAMRELGGQFVLGQTINDALKRGAKRQAQGYTYSYDMLGEAAMTAADAAAFYASYDDAISRLAPHCTSADIRDNPGISIKLSALHPRYEVSQKSRVMAQLVPHVLTLCQQAKSAGMGLNIDADEADRLDLSLDVIEAVLGDPTLTGWDGFGVVVQAYGKRAAPVIDWLYALAKTHNRKIMVRLVKGAYWDTEIKRAQVFGLAGFPVFTSKPAADISYICCARQLLGYTDRIYPQFATHNAHSVAAILEAATDPTAYEFQRLHGMGNVLHDLVKSTESTRCRIYAPVGPHRDLLAYLVRRLLENGANSSFVNQIVDEDVPAAVVAADPFEAAQIAHGVVAPDALYAPQRTNSQGWDLHDTADLSDITAARTPFQTHRWGTGDVAVLNPADPSDIVGHTTDSTAQDVAAAIKTATPWDASPETRQDTLNRAADLYEANFGAFFALLSREAGKTPLDAISELREAVDFLRYYGAQALTLTQPARGIITCISPWNFPLAIFTGQIAGALAGGNAVLAKPAEATTLTAQFATDLLHQAGIPKTALHLLPGPGQIIGQQLVSAPSVNGVCFTGSTQTAQHINRAMAKTMAPTAPLIAETGGLNAMIVDSTALPEQAVRDIVASAFQSAGQRCSALRVLYVQQDIAAPLLHMLTGAMDELITGNPWDFATDIGPVIDATAKAKITAHINAGDIIHQTIVPDTGHFVAPTILKITSIADLKEEIFGPVLHVATFAAKDLDQIIADINATGYGLTFGMHSRINDRIEQVTQGIDAGNLYINRNQIGAVVGSQPFGGHGLSGTGPKAGGPAYVPSMTKPTLYTPTPGETASRDAAPYDVAKTQTALTNAPAPSKIVETSLPGPTGESNRLTVLGCGTVLCLGPGDAAQQQAAIAQANGCATVLAPGLPLDALKTLTGIDAVALWDTPETLQTARLALAARAGALVPLLAEDDMPTRCQSERHVCIDTTAAGGNADLLAQAT